MLHNDTSNKTEPVVIEVNEQSLLLLGYLLFEGGKYAEAIECFTMVLKMAQQPTYYANRGVAYFQQGNFDAAIQDFNEAIRLNPHDAGTLNYRGVAQGEQGQYDLAINDFSEAIRLNPDKILFYINRAKIYFKQHQYVPLIQDANAIISQNSDNAEAYRMRGIAYFYQGQYFLAIEDLSRSIDLKLYDDKTYYSRGESYSALNISNLAIQDFSEAIRLNSKAEEAYMSRGLLYFSQQEEKYDLAIQDFKSVLELNPTNIGAYNNLSCVYYAQKKYSLALKDCNNALRIDPHCKTARKNRDRINYLMNHLEGAIEVEYRNKISEPNGQKYIVKVKSERVTKNEEIIEEKLFDEVNDTHLVTSNVNVSKQELREAESHSYGKANKEEQNKKIEMLEKQMANMSRPSQRLASTDKNNSQYEMAKLIRQHSPIFREAPKPVLNESSELALNASENQNERRVSAKKF